jgi:hypothetical protein
VFIPVFGKELAHVQFRSLEEQLFRAMAVLFDQQQRQGVARLVGMSAPVSLFTPTVDKMPKAQELTKKYLDACYEKLPFALRHDAAQKQLADRAENFSDEILKEVAGEPIATRRRIP